jgi:hypothetical protein
MIKHVVNMLNQLADRIMHCSANSDHSALHQYVSLYHR